MKLDEHDESGGAGEGGEDQGDVLAGLSPKQEQAIVALLNEPTVKKAAEASGVGQRTLYRWMEDPAFARAYRKARRESFGDAISLTMRYSGLAVNTLAKLLNDPTCPASAKVAAATAMLKFSRESIELDDLAARVEVLEAAQAEQEQQKGARRCA